MIKSRFISVLVSLFVIQAAFSQFSISLSDLKLKPGQTGTVNIAMENSEASIQTFDFTICLPDGVKFVSDDANTALSWADGFTVPNGMGISGNFYGGTLIVAGFSMSGSIPKSESSRNVWKFDVIADADAQLTKDSKITLQELTFGSPENDGYDVERVEGNLTIYSVFNVSAISADEEMGTVSLSESGEVENGSSITATATAKDGYKFVNWTNAAGVEISTENPYKFTAEKNIDLCAFFKAQNYDVNFQVDGVDNIQSLPYGSVITAPENPAKTGYTFTGWNPAFEEGATVPLKGITYKATWSINQYTITFDTDGGSAVEAITQNYATEVTAPENPTKTGYTFVGWDTAVPETMPAENKTIKAVWQINQYTITFDTDGGSAVEAITQDYATEVKAPEKPVKEGHTFLGWDKDIPATMPAEDVTITAKWQINQYTLTFDSKGGSEVASITLPYGSEVTAPENPTREGYTFSGWDTEIPATMLAEDKTFTAQWTINQYEVIFKAGENYSKSFVMDYGTLVNDIIPEDVPQTNEEGLPFVGWEPVIDENTTVPAHDVTYVAVYSGQFTIKFNTNGGEEMAPIMMEYNAEIGEISDPVRPYYTFSGWTITDEKGKTYDEMPKNMPAANLTLTANWDIDINALKADLMAFLDGVEAPAVSTEAEVYINTDYDYYAVRKAIEDASAALEATDPAEVTVALDQAKVALNPYIEYCKKYGPAVSCEYTLSENWGTIILPFDFVVPQGCTIFTCEGLKEDNLTLDIRVQYTGSKFTPYIMCGTAGQHMQFIGHIKGIKYSQVQYGIMVGVVDRAYTPLTGDYVMQNQQGVIGFYRVNRDTNNPLVEPCHCYLSLPNSKAKVIRWEGITDGIEMVDAEAQDGQTIYNLQGQRLQRQTKGINIVNGKKVLNK